MRWLMAIAVSGSLAFLTFSVYWPVRNFDFINFDDPEYVTGNSHVQAGLSWENVKRSFRLDFGMNWHPLTWWSHMLDCQLFGMNAGAHHLGNVVFHVFNTILLFLLLRKMTGEAWPSAFVAAVFALHPLRVESVAWVAERKDVLSAFFGLLAIWAYANYARKRGVIHYGLMLLWYALSLLSKAMLVTLPFLLLLLDYWPLRRWEVNPNSGLPQWDRLKGLLWEKIPLLLLAIGASAMTILAQQKVSQLESTAALPFPTRIGTALIAYASYLGKMIIPEGLAVLYPHPKGWALWEVAGAGVVLVFFTLIVVAAMQRLPFLFTGWFWYLGTLVPVIGIVQAGWQSMADRFTYFPMVGILIAFTWTVKGLYSWPRRTQILGSAAALAVACCTMITFKQVHLWKDSATLFAHTLRVTKDNPIAQYNYGQALTALGYVKEPIPHYEEAIRLKPGYADAHNNLGYSFMRMGRLEEAVQQFKQTLQIQPRHYGANFNIAISLAAMKRVPEAIGYYRQALAAKPNDPLTHDYLGRALSEDNKPEEALRHFQAALRADPNRPVEMRVEFGRALTKLGQFSSALTELHEAVQMGPRFPDGHAELGRTLLLNGESEEGVRALRTALTLQTNHFEATRLLAWTLATHTNNSVRNGSEALRLASGMATASTNPPAIILETLAAAHAESGDFDQAVQAAERALRTPEVQGNSVVATALTNQLRSYREQKPWRSSPSLPEG